MTEPIDLKFGEDSDEDELTTDDDRSVTETLSPAQYRRYEEQVARILSSRSEHSQPVEKTHLPGKLSESRRQIDALLSTYPVADGPMYIVIECKYYKRKIGVGTVDELVGKLLDVGAPLGVLCAPNGFSKSARRRAKNSGTPQVEIFDLLGDEDLEIDIDEVEEQFLKFDCPALGGDWGDMTWWQMRSTETGETLTVGSCSYCGSYSTRCEECESEDEMGLGLRCGCGFTFARMLDRHREFDGARRTDGEGNEVEFDEYVEGPIPDIHLGPLVGR
jgi:Restriction endonuclease